MAKKFIGKTDFRNKKMNEKLREIRQFLQLHRDAVSTLSRKNRELDKEKGDNKEKIEDMTKNIVKLKKILQKKDIKKYIKDYL